MHPALLAVMPDRGPGVAVRIQAGPGQALELIEDLVNLLRRRFVFRRPGNHAGRQPVLEVQGIGNLAHAERIAAQYHHALARPAFVVVCILEILGRAAAR